MTFQQQLQSITFKSFFDNQMQIVGYNDLFADSRTLVFSVPAPLPSIKHFEKFDASYQSLLDHGIDRVVCISSDYILVGPWAEKQSKTIRGLADVDKQFVSALAQHFEFEKSVDHLARFWQYTVVINNGEPEQLWQNPTTTTTPWRIIKHPKFRYHGCGPNKVIEYLDKTVKT